MKATLKRIHHEQIPNQLTLTSEDESIRSKLPIQLLLGLVGILPKELLKQACMIVTTLLRLVLMLYLQDMFEALWLLQNEIAYALTVKLLNRHEDICIFLVIYQLLVVVWCNINHGSYLLNENLLFVDQIETSLIREELTYSQLVFWREQTLFSPNKWI